MNYEKPILEILQLDLDNVICASPEFGTNTDFDSGDENDGFARP